MPESDLPSLREICESHSWKRDYEKFMPLSRYIYRPIGFLLTWLAVRIGITTEIASWLSGITGIFGLICITAKSMEIVWLGIGFLIFFNILDCVDGTIARVMKTENPYGKFLDSLLGHIVDFPFFIVVSIMLYRHPSISNWFPSFINEPSTGLVIGGVTSFFHILLEYMDEIFNSQIRYAESRTISLSNLSSSNQFEFSDSIQEAKATNWKHILILIDRNIRVRETHYLFLVLSILIKITVIYLLLYCLYFFLHVVFSGLVYVYRAKRLRDKMWA